MRTPNCKCKQCNQPIYRRPNEIERGPVYCSRKCTGVSQRAKESECPVCETQFVGHKKYCSRECANKGRTGIKYDGSRTKCKATKVRNLKLELAKRNDGKCETCNNGNFAILQVHHIILRKKGGSNELKNLKLICPNCHMEEHHGCLTYQEYCDGKT